MNKLYTTEFNDHNKKSAIITFHKDGKEFWKCQVNILVVTIQFSNVLII